VVDPPTMIGLLGHPLRREILKHFVDKNEQLSPNQVSKELGEPLNSVGYHVKVLRDAGALILVDEQPVRGSTQHFYIHSDLVTRQPWVREALGLPPLPKESGDDG
jgi:DNA-binding transcriptional ArsR family regulator